MSIEMKAVQAMCVRVLWTGDCLELLELGMRQACGYLSPTAYEVHIPGQSVLYKSSSLSAAKHYIEILLGGEPVVATPSPPQSFAPEASVQ